MEELKEIYKKLYTARFNPQEVQAKNMIWQILCTDFFQKYIKDTDTVIDLGGGYCEFINHIRCREKHVIDLNPEISKFAEKNVQVHNCNSNKLDFLKNESIDIVFASNFFVHLEIKTEMLATLCEIKRVLKKGGKLLILQPNIRYLSKEYWDFFDHYLPLSDLSVKEILEALDYRVTVNIPKFLPYTTKSSFPKTKILIKMYLKMRFAWNIFGKQLFIVAEK